MTAQKNKQIKNSSNLKENGTASLKTKSYINCSSLHPSIWHGHLDSWNLHQELEDDEKFGLPDQQEFCVPLWEYLCSFWFLYLSSSDSRKGTLSLGSS